MSAPSNIDKLCTKAVTIMQSRGSIATGTAILGLSTILQVADLVLWNSRFPSMPEWWIWNDPHTIDALFRMGTLGVSVLLTGLGTIVATRGGHR